MDASGLSVVFPVTGELEAFELFAISKQKQRLMKFPPMPCYKVSFNTVNSMINFAIIFKTNQGSRT